MIRKVFLAFLALGFCTSANTIPSKLEKKINKTISVYFETEEFTKSLVEIPEVENQKVPSDFSKNLYRVSDASGDLGYVYIGNAPSKTATFDYLVLFDTSFIVKTSKVLIYREEYGGEISSKRWLKQFSGKTPGDSELKYREDISAISGATISVRSMTKAMNNLLQSLASLQKAAVL